jgi:hypothetical protein
MKHSKKNHAGKVAAAILGDDIDRHLARLSIAQRFEVAALMKAQHDRIVADCEQRCRRIAYCNPRN